VLAGWVRSPVIQAVCRTGSSRFVVNTALVVGVHAAVFAALVSRIRTR